MDLNLIRKLLDEALETAHTAGMEAAAEMEGVSWTGKGLAEADAAADVAREALEKALGLSKVVPVTDEIGGPVVGSAVVDKEGMATITLNDSPEAQAIHDKIKGPHHGHPGFGISSKGTKE